MTLAPYRKAVLAALAAVLSVLAARAEAGELGWADLLGALAAGVTSGAGVYAVRNAEEGVELTADLE